MGKLDLLELLGLLGLLGLLFLIAKHDWNPVSDFVWDVLGVALKKKQKNKRTKIKDLLPTVPTANILLSDKAISRKMLKIPSEI